MTTYALFPRYFSGTSALAEVPNGVIVRSRTATTFLSVSLNSLSITSTLRGISFNLNIYEFTVYIFNIDIYRYLYILVGCICFKVVLLSGKRKRWGKKFVDKRNWKEANGRLVRHGTMLVSVNFLEKEKEVLKEMNYRKVGRPFKYINPLFEYAGLLHCYLRLPFRQTEGIIIGFSEKEPLLKKPDFSTINRRFNSLPTKIQPRKTKDGFTIIIDSTGISTTNRSEWMRKIHRKGKIDECKGFLKLHVAIDEETKEILTAEITTEKVGDNKKFNELVEGSINNTGKKASKIKADGSYPTYENYELLHELGIEPIINIPNNALTGLPENKYTNRRRNLELPLRTKHAKEQLKNKKKWRKEKQYGKRWGIETRFSTVKRRFEQYAQATNYPNMQHEQKFKLQLYNQLL